MIKFVIIKCELNLEIRMLLSDTIFVMNFRRVKNWKHLQMFFCKYR